MLPFLGSDGSLSPASANAKFASTRRWGRWSVYRCITCYFIDLLSSQILTRVLFDSLLFGVVLFVHGNDRMLNDDDRSFSAIP